MTADKNDNNPPESETERPEPPMRRFQMPALRDYVIKRNGYTDEQVQAHLMGYDSPNIVNFQVYEFDINMGLVQRIKRIFIHPDMEVIEVGEVTNLIH